MASTVITKTIMQNFGSLGVNAAGWSKDLTFTSWNGAAAKFDIREWSPDAERCGKGITMTKEEVRVLRDILNTLELD